MVRQRFLAAGKLVILAGVLVGTYGVFAIAGLQLALKTREVPVPNLREQTVDEATVTLAAVGLTARIEPLRRVHATIADAHVVEQDPSAGLTTRRRRSVKLWLSSGPTPGSVPTLIGETESGARRRLVEDSFTIEGVSEIRSGRYPTNAVVAQDSPPSSSGQAVSLLVNRGERGRTYVMPDLIGVAGTASAEILRTRGFRVTVVGDHPYPGVLAGIVLRQFPPAGFQIAHGEPISLEVSR